MGEIGPIKRLYQSQTMKLLKVYLQQQTSKNIVELVNAIYL